MRDLRETTKLVLSDIDGTLLCKDGSVNEITLSAISNLIKKNIYFSFCTGRFKTGCNVILEQFSLSNNKICGIYDNGAYIEAFGKPIYSDGLSKEEILDINEKSKKFNARGVLFQGGCWFVEKKDEWFDVVNSFYQDRGEVKPFNTVLNNSVKGDLREREKLVLRCSNSESMNLMIEELKSIYKNHTFFLSHSDILEVSLKHINKGEGMKILATHLGVNIQNTISFGDFDNDIELLQYAGCGVAVKNATEKALLSADYITLSSDDGGVGDFLYKYVL